MKMNTMLAKVDHLSSSANQMIRDYASFFKTKQGAFKGEKNTYAPREGFLDKPEKRSLVRVTTTVQEKLNWFEERYIPFLQDLFSIEATNSLGAHRVELKVGDVSFGFLSAAELMRLRNILTSKELDSMYVNIPVRSDAKIYEACTDEEYQGREIVQTPISRSVERTTEKEEVILKDPNIDPAHLPANYRSTTVVKTKMVEVGDSTHQEFTGEWTQHKRAELLKRKSELLSAITIALKEVNEVDAVRPNLDAEALISFLHYGKK